MSVIMLLPAMLATPHALAAPAPTVVLTDPANDVTIGAGLAPASDPRIDILDASMAETTSTLTAIIHVTDLDAAVSPPPGASDNLSYQLGMQLYAYGPAVIFTATTDPVSGQQATWSVADPRFGPYSGCSGPASAVFDTAADTVAITADPSAINTCSYLATTPLSKGTVVYNFNANTTTNHAYPGLTFGGAEGDYGSSSSSYTLQH